MSVSPRIHILGLGNLGRLFAHALANQPTPPPVTLLLHRSTMLKEWEENGRRIEIITNGVPSSRGTFDVEDVSVSNQGPIENLIVTTKAINTAKAIGSVKDRLGKNSTILFAQNGMGTLEEIRTSVFGDESTRPNFLAAITSHGVYSQGPFRSVHAGLANVTIGHVFPKSDTGAGNPQKNLPRYLLDQIVNAPVLSATEVTPQELLNLQLEKLVVNAMMNPLTVIFNCKNGELFNRPPILRLMHLLLKEVSQVLQSLSKTPQDVDRFSVGRLEERVLSVAEKTAMNTSSMLQDVQGGRETEIDYINGWIVRKGREVGVKCELNATLVKMVKESVTIHAEDIGSYFPV